MMASLNNKALYTGMTSDLNGRVWQHKTGHYEGFSKKYKCYKLVWYEDFQQVSDAIDCERKIKKFRREKKERLVFEQNREWKDLAADWYDESEIEKIRKENYK